MSSVELSVVAPCLNEEANLSALYERLFAAVEAAGIDTELIVVDDGSTDGTWDTIAALARCVAGKGPRRPPRREPGIAASWRSGVDAAAGSARRASSTPTSRIPRSRSSRSIAVCSSRERTSRRAPGRASADSATRASRSRAG